MIYDPFWECHDVATTDDDWTKVCLPLSEFEDDDNLAVIWGHLLPGSSRKQSK